MKQHATFVITLLASICFFSSCKKDKTTSTEESRLTTVTTTSSGGTTQTLLDYNDGGKIIRVRGADATATPYTIWDISYSGNQIIMTTPGENSSASYQADTIWLTLDNNNRVQKRIQHITSEYKLTNPSYSYSHDTTVYEYDAAGLITKGSRGYWDSMWFNHPGMLQITSVRKNGTDTYINTNANVTAINTNTNIASVDQENGVTTTFKGSETTSTGFQYTKGYANKTDFKNAAVLNELGLFTGAPINPNYANLPDHMVYTATTKDNSGSVIRTDSWDNSYNLGYHSSGFLNLYQESVIPNLTRTYIYSK